jgi:hypothetical protein
VNELSVMDRVLAEVWVEEGFLGEDIDPPIDVEVVRWERELRNRFCSRLWIVEARKRVNGVIEGIPESIELALERSQFVSLRSKEMTQNQTNHSQRLINGLLVRNLFLQKNQNQHLWETANPKKSHFLIKIAFC